MSAEMNLPKTGDVFRIRTRRLSASGTVTKVNRVTFNYDSVYNPRPGYEQLMHLKGNIGEYADAEFIRDGKHFKPATG